MKRLFVIVLAMLMCFGMASCSSGYDERLDFVEGDSIFAGYNKLDYDQQQIYNTLSAAFATGVSSATVSSYEYGPISGIYEALVADHPEFFWLGKEYSIDEKYEDNTALCTITSATLAKSPEELQTMNNELAQVEYAVMASVNQCYSDFDKVVFIHDYIVNHTVYDRESSTLLEANPGAAANIDATTAYGCLVRQKAVSSGYAAAFQYLAQKAGFLCGRVSGFGADGKSHEWNYIRLAGEYYFVDVAWDDPVSEDGAPRHSYEFLLIDENELLKTHRFAPWQSFPDCYFDTMNYYAVNNLYLDKYFFDAFKVLVESDPTPGSIEVKFSSEREAKAAFKELIEEKRIFELSVFSAGVSYATSRTGTVLKLETVPQTVQG